MEVVHLDMGESAHQLLTVCTLGCHKLQKFKKKKMPFNFIYQKFF